MKMKKTHRLGALLLAMMMLFTTLPVTALAETPETEMLDVEETLGAVPKEQTVETTDAGVLDIPNPIVPKRVHEVPTVRRDVYIKVSDLKDGLTYSTFGKKC